MNKKTLWSLALALLANQAIASEKTTIRLGVLASGTLAWEVAAMQNEGLLDKADFQLDPVALANQQAGKIALQAGSADMIVSDWIWVSDMRAQQHDFTFYPYSTAVGGLVVPADSPINSIADLKGKKLGIAGGELDKNWALLQALAEKQTIDLKGSVEKVFGAPPLLNQQLTSGRIDALLTYWHFAARLESQGYRQLMSGTDIIRDLGIQESVPSLGYVFKDSWAKQHPAAVRQFLQTARAAKDKLCESDQAWAKIAPLTHSKNPADEKQTRARYCEGRVGQWSSAEQKAAAKIYPLLKRGKSGSLQTGTFWPAD